MKALFSGVLLFLVFVSVNGQMVEVINTEGYFKIRADACGTNNLSCPIIIEKPLEATTVHKAYLYYATVGLSLPDQGPNAISINGGGLPTTVLNLTNHTNSSGTVIRTRYDDISGVLSAGLDAATPGTNITYNIFENSTGSIDGVGMIVVWNTPTSNLAAINVTIGAENTLIGANGVITTLPIDITQPGFFARFGLGVSFSTATTDQICTFEINGVVVSDSAGGLDDGTDFANGSLITLGGFGDDPFAGEDELWDISALIPMNATSTTWEISSPSGHGADYINAVYMEISGVDVPPVYTFEELCLGDSTSFVINNVDSAFWDFGDPATGAANFSELLRPKHVFSDTGTFVVNLIMYHDSIVDTVDQEVYINPYPTLDLGRDTSLCEGQTLMLDATTPQATYEWQNSSSNSTFLVSQQAIYWCDVTVNNCTTRDSVNVTLVPSPPIELGADTVLCIGDSLTLFENNPATTQLWSNGTTDSTFQVPGAGKYWISVTANECTSTDSITVSFYVPPDLDLGNDTILCPDAVLHLQDTTPDVTRLWSDSTTLESFGIIDAGTYWLQLTHRCQSFSDTINVDVIEWPRYNFDNDTSLCWGDSIILAAITNHETALYSWRNGTTDSINVANHIGYYWVEVLIEGCSFRHATFVSPSEDCEIILIMPNIITPNSDGVNDLLTPVKMRGIVALSTRVYNRWGRQVHKTQDLLINWDATSEDGSEVADGMYFWTIDYVDYLGNGHKAKGYFNLHR